MGQLTAVQTKVVNAFVQAIAPALERSEREAVLGDLAEAQQDSWQALAAVSGLVVRRLAERLRNGHALFPVRAAMIDSDATEIETWPEWIVPLVIGLFTATCVVALLLPPRANTLTWSGVMSRSAFLLGMAALAAISAIALLHRIYRDYFRRPGNTLLACAWMSAIWIPLLLLMRSEHAIWVVLAPAPIAGVVASFAKRKRLIQKSVDYPAAESGSQPLFACSTQFGIVRPAGLAVIIACLFEALAAAAIMRELPLMCSLVILITACMAWGFTPGRVDTDVSTGASSRARLAVLPCFLLTCLALTPFLRMGLGSSHLSSIVLANPLQSAPHVVSVPARVYPGVVLMAPPLPKRKILMSPPHSVLGGIIRPAHPLFIPFDGAYWYFQAPATSPAPGTKIQRGNPLKEHVHSSDWESLEMEAHQRLGQRIDASCCRSLNVAVVSGDTRIGLIQVEAKLRNVTDKGTESVSLGTVPIRSSMAKHISTVRPNIAETLHFPMNGKTTGRTFNEITLVFHLAWGRQLAGAMVQVSSFTLQP